MENIDPDNSDPFYRYKKPKLITKNEGSGNKTIFVNCNEIAKSLGRDPMIFIKYFGYEIGSQVTIDEKNQKYIIKGKHNLTLFQEIEKNFIRKFVLCKKCKNPETEFFTLNQKDLKMNCKACGSNSEVDEHKITSSILKTIPISKKEIVPKKEILSTPLEKLEPEEDFAYQIENKKLKNSEYRSYAENLSLSPIDSAAILIQVLLQNDFQDCLFKNKDLISEFVNNDKLSQLGILYGIERLISTQLILIPKTSGIIQWLYLNDIVEEDVIFEWFEKSKNKFRISKESSDMIRKSAQIVINWLKESD